MELKGRESEAYSNYNLKILILLCASLNHLQRIGELLEGKERE